METILVFEVDIEGVDSLVYFSTLAELTDFISNELSMLGEPQYEGEGMKFAVVVKSMSKAEFNALPDFEH